jgi:hypothetical protein
MSNLKKKACNHNVFFLTLSKEACNEDKEWKRGLMVSLFDFWQEIKIEIV